MTVDSCHYDAPAVLERQFWNCKTDDGHGNGQLSVFFNESSYITPFNGCCITHALQFCPGWRRQSPSCGANPNSLHVRSS